MLNLREIVIRRLRELDLGPIEAATKSGLERTYIRDIVDGRKKSVRADKLSALAAALQMSPQDLSSADASSNAAHVDIRGLPVIGTIQAGNWMDTSLISPIEEQYIPVASDGRFRSVAQYALIVQGDSMDKEFAPGTYVTCVPLYDSGIDLRDGMIVHVERSRDEGRLVEATLKKVAVLSDGIYLLPQSTNPKHKPIKLDGDDNTEIVIRGVIVGNWRPVDY